MIAFREVDGERVGYLLPDVPEDAPAEIREGVARRNVVALGGACPCGATLRLPNRAERRRAARTGQPVHVEHEHENENDCPAITETLAAAIARWRR